MSNNSNTIIFILAAGEGKRMKTNIPKVLNIIKNKPMIIHIINQCLIFNPFKINIIVGKHKQIINETIQQYLKFEDFKKLNFIEQINPQGTGHAMICCQDYLRQHINNNFKAIILYGDVPFIQHTTIEKINTIHDVNITTTIKENPYGSGRIILNNNEFIKIIEEKDCNQEQKKIKQVNCGIYSIKVDLLYNNLSLLTNNNAQQEYYLTDIIEIIKKQTGSYINIVNIPENKQYQVCGVNTKDELIALENKI